MTTFILTLSSCGGDDSVAVTGIELNKTVLSLQKGSTEMLVAKVKPSDASNQSIVWTSSNPSVATVTDNGLVAANAAGSAVIIATSRDGQFTATCQVTVQVNMSAIILNSTSLILEKGDETTLAVQITPEDATDKTLLWTVNDPTVASIDNSGKVVALKNGTTTIIVRNSDDTVKAECKVTVITSVVSVILNKNEMSLVMGQTEALIATILPEDASNKNVTWTSSNENVATISSTGIITAINPGTTSIIVLTEDKSKTASCLVTVVSPTKVDYTPYDNEQKW